MANEKISLAPSAAAFDVEEEDGFVVPRDPAERGVEESALLH